jgi:hypothetical protein
MEEEDARLALLIAELGAIQSQIQAADSRIFQIKGWCVTTSLAIGGFAAAYHRPSLLIVGAGSVLGFYLINCQFRYYWRLADEHNRTIDAELKRAGIMTVLKGKAKFEVVGTGTVRTLAFKASAGGRTRRYTQRLLHEAFLPNTFGLYVFILFCFTLEALVLVL